MSVLVEEQFRGRVARPVRRTGQVARRRPPSGVVAMDPRPVARVASCRVERDERKSPLVLTLAASVFAIVALFGVVVGGMAEGADAPVPDRTVLVSVAPGQSLWDLAAEYAPDSDPRDVVERIQTLNELSSGAVAAGYPLAVPVQAGSADAQAGR